MNDQIPVLRCTRRAEGRVMLEFNAKRTKRNIKKHYLAVKHNLILARECAERADTFGMKVAVEEVMRIRVLIRQARKALSLGRPVSVGECL